MPAPHAWSCGELARGKLTQKNPRMGVRGFFRSCQADGAQIRRGVNVVGLSLLKLDQSSGRVWEQMVTIKADGSIRR